ncbi:MAG: GumC family protein [Methylovirgula sp.]
MNQPFDPDVSSDDRTSELDLRALWQAIQRKRSWILWPTLLAFVGIGLFVMLVKPTYTAESQVLLENQESYLPNSVQPAGNAPTLDVETVGSQVQLVKSRDIARKVIEKLHLIGNPEFDPAAKPIGPFSRVLMLFGLIRDPTTIAPEDRVTDVFERHLTVFSPTKTHVLTIQFSAHSPDLAAGVANEIVALYLRTQSNAKRERAKEAVGTLATQIGDLRSKLTTAADNVERYRASSGLLSSTNNMTISGQQLSDLNGELSKARTAQADAQAKAMLVREMIRQGRLSDIADVANNDLVRRISEQAVTAKAQLAFESRTLLPGHPRIKELRARIADLDQQLRSAVGKTARSLENNARIAAARVSNIETALNQQKGTVVRANADQVHLRELERVAQALRSQLDASMAKYQDATAREDSSATPADARMITRAVAPDQPSFPKKIPMIIFGTLAAFILSLAVVISSELLTSPATGDYNGPVAQPRAIADDPENRPSSAPLLDRLRDFRRAAADMHRKLTQNPPSASSRDGVTPPTAKPAGAEAAIGRGARIIAISLEESGATADVLIAFARNLTQEGRPIIIDIDAHGNQLAALKRSDTAGGVNASERRVGLTDLLNGNASFAEVIHRDAISRLHFINFGAAEDFDSADLDLVLEALAETYDFILLAAPALAASDLAKSLASHADLVVLVGTGKTAHEKCNKARHELMAAGAHEVVVIGAMGKQEAPVLSVA